MVQLIFNITFYLIGLLLASIPFLSNRQSFREKSLLYRILMPSVLIALLIMGIVKTKDDYASQKDANYNLVKINSNISGLKRTIEYQDKKYQELIDNLKHNNIEIKDNKPVVKSFNNKINTVGTMNQY